MILPSKLFVLPGRVSRPNPRGPWRYSCPSASKRRGTCRKRLPGAFPSWCPIAKRMSSIGLPEFPWWFHVGMSENEVYPQWNSHLLGIMISKTIGWLMGTLFSDKPMVVSMVFSHEIWQRLHGPSGMVPAKKKTCGFAGCGLSAGCEKKKKKNLLDSPRPRYIDVLHANYPLVNKHSYGKSPFLMGKLTINGHFL